MSTNLDGPAETPGMHDSCAQKEYARLTTELDAIQENIAQGRPAAIRKTVLSAILAIGGVIGAYKTSNPGEDLMTSPVPLSSATIALIGAGAARRFQKGINGPTDLETERRMMMLEQELFITTLQLKKESYRTNRKLEQKA